MKILFTSPVYLLFHDLHFFHITYLDTEKITVPILSSNDEGKKVAISFEMYLRNIYSRALFLKLDLACEGCELYFLGQKNNTPWVEQKFVTQAFVSSLSIPKVLITLVSTSVVLVDKQSTLLFSFLFVMGHGQSLKF